MEVNELNKFILDENITGNKEEGKLNGNPVSVFFSAEKLFQAGMTEEEFISQYEQVIAYTVLGLVKNEENNFFDISSISDEDKEKIDEAAKKYFQAIDKDGDGVLAEEEVNGLASKDGISETISNDDVASLTKELFNNPTEETVEKTTEETTENNNVNNNKTNSNFNLTSPNNHNSNLNENKDNVNSINSTDDINEKISKINQEISDLNEQKQTEMANNTEYVLLISESQELNKSIFASEDKIEKYKSELHTIEYDLSAATSELNNTQNAQFFEEYQSTIDKRKTELQNQINSLQQKQIETKKKITEEEKKLEDLNSQKEENDKQISEIEKASPNTQINSINVKITELTTEKINLQNQLAEQRKQEISDAEVYGKAQAYRNSELTAAFLNPLITEETKAKYDEYYYKSKGYSYCDQFVRNGVNDFYASVMKEMGLSDKEIEEFTAKENEILKNANINSPYVSGSEYVRECSGTKTWGEDYQKVLDKMGIDMNSAVNITEMSEEERINAVREGKIYPGMTFLTLKNGQYHVGIVESINKDLSWNTIEGNTYIKYSDGSSETGTVGSHKSDATNTYLQGLSDVMAKVCYWMKMKGYSDSEIKKYIYNKI